MSSPKIDMSKIIEYEAGRAPIGRRIPLQALLRQNRQRWYMDTSIGRVYLRRITQLDMERISLEIVNDYPELIGVIKRLAAIASMERSGVPMDAETKDEAVELGRQLLPLQKQYARACFVTYVCERCRGKGKIEWAQDNGEQSLVDCPKCKGSGNGTKEVPQFNSDEEYDAFVSALPPDELESIYQLLADISNPVAPGEVNSIGLAISKEMNIPVSNDLTVENMTAQQGSVFADIIQSKIDALKRVRASNTIDNGE